MTDAVRHDEAGGLPLQLVGDDVEVPCADQQDEHTGDFWRDGAFSGWTAVDRAVGASCARG
jgi:hypothetical protein